MPFNGVGMFVRLRNWVADAAAGVKIRADYHDLEDDGFADGLSHCITRDGQTVVLQNIPMNSKRITALADPVDPQDAATKAYADLKLPLVGGTISGSLTVNGQVTTTGYKCRAGLSGAYGANWFNFNWTGGGMEVWADDYKWGVMATQAYVEQRAQDWAHAIADPKINRAGDTMGGLLTTAASGSIVAGGSTNSIQVIGATNDWAAMSFHSPGSFACNFGLNPNGNFYQGGWSLGSTPYMFWTERNLNPIKDGRLVHVGSPSIPAGAGIYEPYSGAVMTGLALALTTGTPVSAVRWRALQLLTPGGWYTVAYA